MRPREVWRRFGERLEKDEKKALMVSRISIDAHSRNGHILTMISISSVRQALGYAPTTSVVPLRRRKTFNHEDVVDKRIEFSSGLSSLGLCIL